MTVTIIPDIYQRIADDFGLTRDRVKQLTAAVVYYSNVATVQEREQEMRAAVRDALAGGE